jgi:cation:H+ antiporter
MLYNTAMILLWVAVFVVALAVLVKGADWFLESAEKIGLRLGMSPFVVGVLIVGLGTSFPELFSGIAAVLADEKDIVVSNAVGSNIANILLVIGIAALAAKRLRVTKNLIDSELPMLAISTVIFLMVVIDGLVTMGESVFLITAYLIYLFYTLYSGEGDESRPLFKLQHGDALDWKVPVQLMAGALGLVLGAKFLIDAVINLSEILNIAPALISITAIAFGTSLPEILVSFKAARAGKPEVAVGNIFGSNAFNALMVVGIPGMFTTLPLNGATLAIGVPVMALATLLFVISGISRTIYRWEGMMFLLFYALFILKLFGIM